MAFVFVPNTFAHVSVKPAQVGVGSFQTFTVSIPVEKDIPTTAIKLVIPSGLKHVTPNVKPGWVITTQKSGEGEESEVVEINWTNGLIPAGMRDEFLFSAQVPSETSTLDWKAYQTYQDGTVVNWDQNPSDDHQEGSTPFSQTKVINDLVTATPNPVQSVSNQQANNLPLVLSVVALALSIVALYKSRQIK